MRKRHYGVAALPTNTNQVYGECSRRLEFSLYGVARLLRRYFDSKARGLRLSRTQCQALLYLHRNEGIDQTCLAQLLDVKAITLVRLIDKLQSMGLIERHADPSDRRVWRLNLTPAARAKVAEVRELGDLTRSEALAGLAPAEIEQLVKTLQVVRANLLNAYNSPAIEGERKGRTRGLPNKLPRRPRVGSTPGLQLIPLEQRDGE
jgi:MarR family transcriptional regulator for hemolysin